MVRPEGFWFGLERIWRVLVIGVALISRIDWALFSWFGQVHQCSFCFLGYTVYALQRWWNHILFYNQMTLKTGFVIAATYAVPTHLGSEK